MPSPPLVSRPVLADFTRENVHLQQSEYNSWPVRSKTSQTFLQIEFFETREQIVVWQRYTFVILRMGTYAGVASA